MTLNIVSRSQWGATPWRGNGINHVAFSEKDCFLVHYHGGEPRHSTGVGVPREVESIHLGKGWDGVGYNFLVDQDGVIYEGRGWTGVGAQCPGYNRRGVGVYVAVGGNQTPSAAALTSVRALYDEHARKLGRAPRQMGHRDGFATACPGAKLYAWVKSGMPSPGVGSAGTSAPAPAPKPKPSGLDVDGKLGPATIRRWQQVMGTTVDGEISYPYSLLVEKVQRHLVKHGHKLAVDGRGIRSNNGGDYGPTNTLRALQRYLGTSPVDGVLSHPRSNAVKALQRRLNEGKF